jgi:hypothetical protein
MQGTREAPWVMISSLTSAEVLALRRQLIDNGWNVVPSSPRTKECYVVGWPSIVTNEFYLAKWEGSFSAHTNTAAVANRDYFGVDDDVISDSNLAHHIQALAFEHLGETPFIRVGRWPKRLLVYRKRKEVIEARNGGRAAAISSPVIKSVSFKAANGSGDGGEILSAGRQFVIHGIHPNTGLPYHWIGEASPLDDTPKDAPLVVQQQVDAFLDAVREIMPLVHAGSGRAGNGGDSERHVNADGLIDDGRESYLRDCIWRAAHEIDETGDALTAQAIAGRGWELFDERAWNGDDKYRRDKQAMEKARLLIRRLGDGRVKLGGVTTPAAPSFCNVKPDIDERDQVHTLCRSYIGTVHAHRRGLIIVLSSPGLVVGSPIIGVPDIRAA